ncbi:MAG: hypothetical protein IPP74_01450 [Alphaproteobacteria bacterium]|nr:hypothetical protein [Alphaproteobacteria bacterium]
MRNDKGTIYVDNNFARDPGVQMYDFVALVAHEVTHSYESNQVTTLLGGYKQAEQLNIDESALNSPAMLQAIIFGLDQGNNYILLPKRSDSNYEIQKTLNNAQPYEATAYAIQNDFGRKVRNWIFPSPKSIPKFTK